MVTTIIEVRIPAGQFPLGRILGEHPDVEIELERLVPVQETLMPLFWIDSGHEDAVEETLRDDPLVETLDRLTRTPERVLYAVTWSPDVDGLVASLDANNVDVLGAEGTADAWTFRLQFRKRVDMKRFRQDCRDDGIDLELLEMYNPLMPPEKGPLTSAEHDVLATALEAGYWDVPRESSQSELADLIGLSDDILSRHLRSGVKTAVGVSLYGPAGGPPDRR